MQKIRTFPALLCLSLVFAMIGACQAEIDLGSPPQIAYGEDVCERCGMIISDSRFAASYVTTDGQVHVFDDIGGMLAHYDDHKGDDVHVFWVHDVESGEWLRAKDAAFIMDGDLTTPMGFGIVAYADEAAARAAASETGTVVPSFSALMDRISGCEMENGMNDCETSSEHNHD